MILVELLKRTEGKTLEFKRDLSSPEGILKCLVAFANTAGGIVVIGVEDGSKNVRGVPDVLASEEKLANLVAEYATSTSAGVSSLNSLTGAVIATGTANQIIVASSSGQLVFSLPQSINTNSAPARSG